MRLNENRWNAFDKTAQDKLVGAVREDLGEDYGAERTLDDALYLMLIWLVEFGEEVSSDVS